MPLPPDRPRPSPPVPPHDVTGVVLAGGQGSRMGGQDKGLQLIDGQPLALCVLRRLRPQVGHLAISANRHLDIYRQWCAAVWPDAPLPAGIPAGGPDASATPSYEGPLAGIRTALQNSRTPLVQLAACDTPFFPADLVALLRARLDESTDIVLPATLDAQGRRWTHPTFALLRRRVLPSLEAYMAQGERKVMRWAEQRPHAVVELADHDAMRNFNTLRELADHHGA